MKSNRDTNGVAASQPVGLSSQNPVVDQIGQMQFEGSILDKRWFQCEELKFKNGKLNLPALVVLADILWWHRPTLIIDEASNQITDVKAKFSQNELWKSYPVWAASLGLTQDQCRNAVKFLSERKIITRRTGSFRLTGGAQSNNVIFLTPIPAAIRRITYGTTANGSQAEAPPFPKGDPPPQKRRPLPVETEISTSSTAVKNSITTTTVDDAFSENLTAQLIAAGAAPTKAKNGVEINAAEMQSRLNFLNEFTPDNPGAWLTAKPEQHFTPPREALAADAQIERDDNAARGAARRRAASAREKKQIEHSTADNAELMKYFKTLPEAQRRQIEAEARRRVGPLAGATSEIGAALGAEIRNQLRALKQNEED